MMGGYQLPVRTIREMITGSIDVIVQVARLRDGSRKVTHITEVLGMEGDVVTLQNLFVYDITGEDAQRPDPRPAPLDRHRASALLGSRAVLRRGSPTRRRRWHRRSARRQRQSAWGQQCLRANSSLSAAALLGCICGRRARVRFGLSLHLRRPAVRGRAIATSSRAQAGLRCELPRAGRTRRKTVAERSRIWRTARGQREGLAAAAPAARRPRDHAEDLLAVQRRVRADPWRSSSICRSGLRLAQFLAIAAGLVGVVRRSPLVRQ